MKAYVAIMLAVANTTQYSIVFSFPDKTTFATKTALIGTWVFLCENCAAPTALKVRLNPSMQFTPKHQVEAALSALYYFLWYSS